MPQGDDPAQSCFTWNNWYEEGHDEYCEDKYDMEPMFDWALDYFGGRNPPKDFIDYRNIVFFNGAYDPWHGGGVNRNITTNSVTYFTPRAAHHYDLRGPHMNDTKEINQTRALEQMHIEKWIAEWKRGY